MLFVLPAVLLFAACGEGLAPVILSDGCATVGGVVTCTPVDFFTGPVPSEPVTQVLRVELDEAAAAPAVTIVVTSRDNPVSNDPDPSNNTIELAL